MRNIKRKPNVTNHYRTKQGELPYIENAPILNEVNRNSKVLSLQKTCLNL